MTNESKFKASDIETTYFIDTEEKAVDHEIGGMEVYWAENPHFSDGGYWFAIRIPFMYMLSEDLIEDGKVKSFESELEHADESHKSYQEREVDRLLSESSIKSPSEQGWVENASNATNAIMAILMKYNIKNAYIMENLKDLIMALVEVTVRSELDRIEKTIDTRAREYHPKVLENDFINGRFWEAKDIIEIIRSSK